MNSYLAEFFNDIGAKQTVEGNSSLTGSEADIARFMASGLSTRP
jgi:hypothetical protein